MLCGSLAGRGVCRRMLSFSILVTSISLASFLFCRVFTSEKGNLKNKPFGLRLRSQDITAPCPSPFLLISAANGKLPSPDPPLASPTSWKCPGCFTHSAHLRFHFVIHWGGCRQGPASLSHGLHPLGCSIKGRQSQWRSSEAETNPETNSSHAEAWILSLKHEGLRCPPVPAAHSSRLQHRGARSARWAPFFPLKPIAPSLGHDGPAEQKGTCILTFTTRSGKSERHRSELDHTTSLGRCLDENSSCGPQIQLLPGFRLWKPEPSACALAPSSSMWGLGYKDRVSLAGYIQILPRPEEKIWNLDSRDSVLQRGWVSGKLTTKHPFLSYLKGTLSSLW